MSPKRDRDGRGEDEADSRLKDLSSYKLGRQLGKGGFSKVYLAVDPDGREVALKVPLSIDMSGDETISLSSEQVAQFTREAEVWQRVSRQDIPGVLHLHVFGIKPFPWFSMELCDDSLATRMGLMSYQEKVAVASSVLNTLNEIHYLGLVHKDVKPGNVMFRGKTPLLTDFGLGREVSRASESSDGYSGTLMYSAPEQFDKSLGSADRKTDIWQAGVLCYELFTGRVPFEGDISSATYAIMNKEPVHPSDIDSDIPRALGDVIMKALKKKRSERWPGCAEMRSALIKASGVDIGEVVTDYVHAPQEKPREAYVRRTGSTDANDADAVDANMPVYEGVRLEAMKENIPQRPTQKLPVGYPGYSILLFAFLSIWLYIGIFTIFYLITAFSDEILIDKILSIISLIFWITIFTVGVFLLIKLGKMRDARINKIEEYIVQHNNNPITLSEISSSTDVPTNNTRIAIKYILEKGRITGFFFNDTILFAGPSYNALLAGKYDGNRVKSSKSEKERSCVKCGRAIPFDAMLCPYCAHDYR